MNAPISVDRLKQIGEKGFKNSLNRFFKYFLLEKQKIF